MFARFLFFPFVLPLLDLIPPHPGLCTKKKPNLILCDLKERKTEKEENRKGRSEGEREEKKEGRKEEASPVPTEDNKEMPRLNDVSISPKKREKLYIPVRV